MQNLLKVEQLQEHMQRAERIKNLLPTDTAMGCHVFFADQRAYERVFFKSLLVFRD